MSFSQSSYDCFLGFDVSKDEITVFDSRTDKVTTVANRKAALADFLRDYGQESYAICEPTGGYETLLLSALQTAGITTHRADTIRVKAFIRSRGTIGKTDAIDARGLSLYAQERWKDLARWTGKDKSIDKLQALVLRRQDLVAIRVAETNRAKAPGNAILKPSFRALLKTLENQIRLIEQKIEETVTQSEELSRVSLAVRTLPGIGPVTAHTLCALMPEIGTVTGKQAAALAGLAPHPKDSGTLNGYRRVRGGRPQIRKAIFMAAMSAIRTTGKLKFFYNRLIERGKKKMVALVAVMRKIIVIANARVRDSYIAQQS